jgi:hypothetical protein
VRDSPTPSPARQSRFPPPSAAPLPPTCRTASRPKCRPRSPGGPAGGTLRKKAKSKTPPGVAARHALPARLEAARKLIQNHAKVIGDVVNQAPATQLELTRLAAHARPHVERMLREVARRLLGSQGGIEPLEFQPGDIEQAAAWVQTAAYLCARVHTPASPKPPSNPGRAPDMGEAAVAAFCDVLREVGLV